MKQIIPTFESYLKKHPLLWFISNIDNKIYNTDEKPCKVEKCEVHGKMEWFVDVLNNDGAEGSFVDDEVIGYENLKELEKISGVKYKKQ